MKAGVTVTLKPGVLDPQGEAVRTALEAMDGKGVKSVRIGKFIEIEMEGKNRGATRARLEKMCQRLLANPVIENYHIEFMEE